MFDTIKEIVFSPLRILNSTSTFSTSLSWLYYLIDVNGEVLVSSICLGASNSIDFSYLKEML
jgi:hypothetical protein